MSARGDGIAKLRYVVGEGVYIQDAKGFTHFAKNVESGTTDFDAAVANLTSEGGLTPVASIREARVPILQSIHWKHLLLLALILLILCCW